MSTVNFKLVWRINWFDKWVFYSSKFTVTEEKEISEEQVLKKKKKMLRRFLLLLTFYYVKIHRIYKLVYWLNSVSLCTRSSVSRLCVLCVNRNVCGWTVCCATCGSRSATFRRPWWAELPPCPAPCCQLSTASRRSWCLCPGYIPTLSPVLTPWLHGWMVGCVLWILPISHPEPTSHDFMAGW